MDNEKYRKLYLQEAATHLEGIERSLLALEDGPDDEELVDGLFRHYHSLKGMSASMGYNPIKDLSHAQEERLAGVRKGEAAVTPELIGTLFSSLDRLKELIGRVEKNEPLEDRDHGESAEEGEGRVTEAAPPDAAPAQTAKSTAIPHAPKKKTEEKTAPPEGTAPPGDAEPVTETAPPPTRASRPSPPASTLRLPGMIKVESAVFDELLSTAGELFMILGVFKGIAQKTRDIDLKDGVYNLEKAVKKLHGRIYATRMLPIEDLTGGLPRIVRDIAAKENKAVRLSMKGTEISVDRAILEDLASPLVHIIRNAVDHGIETQEERRALGKSPVASLRIRAYQKRQRVVIEIADDGRGIDVEKVRARLVEEGMDRDKAAAMSRKDLLMAVCRPGLSTAASVTDVSGRGVGMDVVKEVIEARGGALRIDSEKGGGTTITLELPRTTSIIRTLQVVSGGKDLLAPISPIEKVVEIEDQGPEMKTMEYEGSEIPVLNLAEELGIEPGQGPGAVLVVENGDRDTGHVGILVDDFGMEMEAYVKSLAPPLTGLWGVSGVTVMGDGRPVFILDIPQIASRARHAE